MNKWISDKLSLLIFPAIVLIFVSLVWIGVKYDLGEDAYNEEGNPNIEVHQEYGSR